MLAVAAVVAYGNSLLGGYVWYDHADIEQAHYRVVDAKDWRRIWYESAEVYRAERTRANVETGYTWQPVYALSISLDWALWGDRAWLSHAENVLWHVVVVLGLYFLGIEVFGPSELARRAVFWSTLLFAVHPLAVPSVTWINGRKDLLCAAFIVGSVLASGRAISAADHARRWLVAAVVCLALAIGSRELGFVVPLLAAVLYWPARAVTANSAASARNRRHVALAALWGSALTLYLYRGLVVAIEAWGTGISLNFATSAEILWHYVLQVFVPWRTGPSDAWPLARGNGLAELTAMLGLIAAVLALVYGLWRRAPWALALAWFAILVLPSTGIVPLRHVHSYRHLYPALWGLLLAALLLLFTWMPRLIAAPRAITALLAIWAVCLGAATVRENSFWTDDLALFTRSVQQDPRHVEGLVELGRLSLERGENEAAVDFAHRAVEQSGDSSVAAFAPASDAHHYLGVGHLRREELAAAIDHFKQALSFAPKSARAHIYLGLAASQAGDRTAATESFFRGLQLDPHDPNHGRLVAQEYIKWGQAQVAVELLRGYVKSHPDDWDTASTYGVALTLAGKFGDAEAVFDRLTTVQPEEPAHRIRLAWAQWQLGKLEEARNNYLLARRRAPDHPLLVELQGLIEAEPPGADQP